MSQYGEYIAIGPAVRLNFSSNEFEKCFKDLLSDDQASKESWTDNHLTILHEFAHLKQGLSTCHGFLLHFAEKKRLESFKKLMEFLCENRTEASAINFSQPIFTDLNNLYQIESIPGLGDYRLFAVSSG